MKNTRFGLPETMSTPLFCAVIAMILVAVAGSVASSQSPQRLPAELVADAAPANTPNSPLVGDLVKNVGASGDMIGFSHSDGSGTQTITLVHTGKAWMAVYHIDRSGQIRLVSSRPIDADFSLQLNATSPLPKEIREMGQRPRQ